MSDSLPFHDSYYLQVPMKPSFIPLFLTHTATQHFLLVAPCFASPHTHRYNIQSPMYRQREANPHFLSPPQLQNQPPQQQHGSISHFPPSPQHQDHFPLNPQHQDHFPLSRRPDLIPPSPQHQHQPPPSTQHAPSTLQFPSPRPHQQRPPPQQPLGQRTPHQRQQPQPEPSPLRVRERKTRPFTWFLAVFCALFWIIIIVAGLAILIVYLLFRPRSPKFDISSASLNAAYLDMGYLLNADLTLLTNFSNPSRKVKVDFSYMVIDLYYEGSLVATRYIDPFSVMRSESRFRDVHMVTSQVRLSVENSLLLQRQIERGRVRLEVKGLFRTRSNLGSLLRYSYWLYGHCTIIVGAPPSGFLMSKKCITKR